MAWIESHQELLDHPKVLGLASDMGWDKDLAIGKLHRFWWWSLDYAANGDLRRYNDAQIALGAGVDAQAAKRFVEAMKRSCWVDSTPYFRVHDWWEYAGRFLQVKWKNYPDKWRVIRDSYICSTSNPEHVPKEEAPEGGSKKPPKNPVPNLTLAACTNQPASATLNDVRFAAELIGCPQEEADRFYHHFESMGWVDKNGNPVMNWRSKLAVWAAEWKQKRFPGRTTSVFDLKTQKEAKERRMDELKRKHYSDVQSLTGGTYQPPGWRDEVARHEFVDLRREVEALQIKLCQTA